MGLTFKLVVLCLNPHYILVVCVWETTFTCSLNYLLYFKKKSLIFVTHDKVAKNTIRPSLTQRVKIQILSFESKIHLQVPMYFEVWKFEMGGIQRNSSLGFARTGNFLWTPTQVAQPTWRGKMEWAPRARKLLLSLCFSITSGSSPFVAVVSFILFIY